MPVAGKNKYPERRKKSRVFSSTEGVEILATHADMESAKWTLGLAPSLEDENFCKQISQLAAASNAPNPFFEVPILSASVGRIGKSGKKYLYLSETIGDAETIRFFAPVQFEKHGIFRRPVLRVWSHLFGPLGVPLMAADRNGKVMDELASCLLAIKHSSVEAIIFGFLPKHAGFTEAVFLSPRLASRVYRFFWRERAILQPTGNQSYEQKHLSGKRRQRLRKAAQRLGQTGKAEFESATCFNDVMLRFEEFLLLETKSWKGRKGTSLQRIKQTAAFARQAVANMARQNRCTIHTLRLDGVAVSSLIVFEANGYYYPWKTAFDEDFSHCSVGNLLLVHVSSELAKKPGFKGIDSLAAEDNETTNRFWQDRMELYDMVVGIGRDAEKNAAKMAREIDLIKRFREMIKQLLRR